MRGLQGLRPTPLGWVMVAALGLAAGFASGPYLLSDGQWVKTAEYIEEDDPRWDCETMGNMICGPTP